jgi:phosphoribosylformimino-5-aminoimidazole carboxamide ribotide isomerase
MIIPSIDLMSGKAVQLRQGKEKVLEKDNIKELAEKFGIYGEIAVIDLDAALGKGNNAVIIKELCRTAECRIGGGIRNIETAKEFLRAGAKKIIIGTEANKEFLKQLPKDNVIVAIDTKDGLVATKGWTEKTDKTPFEVIKELEDYCSEFLFTNVNREGLMQGIDFEEVKKIKETTKNKITAAGGISSIEEIKKLEELGINSQLGMSIYTNKIDLTDAFVSLLDFEKNNSLIPTIVQEATGQVLMLSFSTKESLKKALEEGKGTYYSRSRNIIWTKGKISGNTQELMRVKYDCDRDSLLFIVKQKNAACHTGRYSCFGEKEFSINDTYEIIQDRIKNPKEESYTSSIAKDEEKIKEKIIEEANELIKYESRENLVWEAADLIYFVMMLLAKNNILFSEIKNELRGRMKCK